MSILDKYPPPWTMDQCASISASNGSAVAYAPDDGRGIRDDDDGLRRLILAAPELLSVLDRLLRAHEISIVFDLVDEARALIARIKGKT